MATLLPGLLAWLLPAIAVAQEAAPAAPAEGVVIRVVLEDGEGGPVLDASGLLAVAVVTKRTSELGVSRLIRHDSTTDADFRDGRCMLTASPGAEFAVRRIIVLGRDALPTPDCRFFTVPEQGDVELRCRYSRPFVLDVVAAESGEPLEGVIVTARRPPNDDGLFPESPVSPLIRRELLDAASPIELKAVADWNVAVSGTLPLEATAVLHVTAPDREWAFVSVDFYDGGRERIELARAGALHVDLAGDVGRFISSAGDGWRVSSFPGTLPSQARVHPWVLRLHRRWADGEIGPRQADLEEELAWYESLSDEEVVALAPDGRRPSEAELVAQLGTSLDEEALGDQEAARAITKDGSIVTDHLPIGRYRVALERQDGGRWIGGGETEVDVVAGETTRITLPIVLPPKRLAAAVRGSIVLPAGWRLGKPELRFVEVGNAAGGLFGPVNSAIEASIAADALGPFITFVSPPLAEGRWTLLERKSGASTEIDVRYSERNEIRFELPELADVAVRLIDAATGMPWSEPVTLMLLRPRPLWDPFSSRAVWDAPSGRWWLQVAPRDAEFRAGDGGEPLEIVGGARRTLAPGLNEFDLALRRPTLVRLDHEFLWMPSEPGRPRLALELRRARLVPVNRQGPPVRVDLSGDHTIWPNPVFTIDEPGRYRLEIPPLRDYELSAPVEIDVRAGETTLVELPLVRRE